MDKKSYLSARRVARRGYRRMLDAEAALLWLQLEQIRRRVDPLAERVDAQAHYLRAGLKCTARDTASVDTLMRFDALRAARQVQAVALGGNPPEIVLTESQYEATHTDFRGVWSTERTDWRDWAQVRDRYIGKRTFMYRSALYIEGMGLTIVPDRVVA